MQRTLRLDSDSAELGIQTGLCGLAGSLPGLRSPMRCALLSHAKLKTSTKRNLATSLD